ncbi:MAG: motility associated factor glycosyltransferase family protein [Candidatus Coatesbacteria bacterium]|nr:motility associated factor glycosyltransferase family protein [Candidatus Coatesbacteria bacterium]
MKSLTDTEIHHDDRIKRNLAALGIKEENFPANTFVSQIPESRKINETSRHKFLVSLGISESLLEHIDRHPEIERILLVERDPEALVSSVHNLPIAESLVRKDRLVIFLWAANLAGYSLADAITDTIRKTDLRGYLSTHYVACARNEYEDEYELIKASCQNALFVYGDDMEDSFNGLKHMVRNMAVICNNPGIDVLKDKYVGIPAIVISAGTDLDKERVEILKKHKDKFLVFAVDAVARKLILSGLSIDFICTLERVAKTAEFLKDIPEELSRNTVLLSVPVVHPSLYANWKGQIINIFRPYSHFRYLQMEGFLLDTGPSAANMALHAAYHMGASPIILAGQNLCYEDGKSHCDFVPQDYSISEEGCIMIEENGREFITRKEWLIFRNSFSDFIRKKKCRVINTTRNGLFIDGAEINTDLNEVLEREGKFFSREEIKNPSCDEIKANWANWYEKSGRAISYLKWISYFCYHFHQMAFSFTDNLQKGETEGLKMIQHAFHLLKQGIEANPLYYFLLVHVIQSRTLMLENKLNFCDKDEKGLMQRLEVLKEFSHLVGSWAERIGKEIFIDWK